MIARLGPKHILASIAWKVLADPIFPSRASWFAHIRELLSLYGLPHPTTILSIVPTKSQWSRMVRKAILSHWHTKLVSEVSSLPSLSFLHASHLSLAHPHLLWTTAPSGPLPSRQAALMARILSGRYQSCWLRRHWDGSNGACRLPSCGHIPGDVTHIFSGSCPALFLATEEATRKLALAVAHIPPVASLLTEVSTRDPRSFTQFMLDPSTDPEAIQLYQAHGSIV